MPDTLKPLPCPFCKGVVIPLRDAEHPTCQDDFYCQSCGCRFRWPHLDFATGEHEAKILASFNRRTSPEVEVAKELARRLEARMPHCNFCDKPATHRLDPALLMEPKYSCDEHNHPGTIGGCPKKIDYDLIADIEALAAYKEAQRHD